MYNFNNIAECDSIFYYPVFANNQTIYVKVELDGNFWNNLLIYVLYNFYKFTKKAKIFSLLKFRHLVLLLLLLFLCLIISCKLQGVFLLKFAKPG